MDDLKERKKMIPFILKYGNIFTEQDLISCTNQQFDNLLKWHIIGMHPKPEEEREEQTQTNQKT